jgi:hypothetical protein
MRTVTLSGRKARGRVARVDDADYEIVSQHKWHVSETNSAPGHRPHVCARTNIPRPGGGQATLHMHTLITGIRFVDHDDGDGLNNQRANLRPADHALNNANRRPASTHGGKAKTSRYKGVRRFRPGPGKGRERWQARIRIDGHLVSLGYFNDEEAAARAYDAAARAAWGEFACPNFP